MIACGVADDDSGTNADAQTWEEARLTRFILGRWMPLY